MNHKRKKTRRRVRCQLCTPHRWRGNNRGRFKAREEAVRRALARDARDAREAA